MTPRRLYRKAEDGFFTIWTLGLCVCVLILGGVFIDLWHAFDERRQVAAMVDSAAVAGANRIDINTFKATGKVRLGKDADDVAEAFLKQQAAQVGMPVTAKAKITGTGGGGTQVEVVGTHTMKLLFIGAFVGVDDLQFSVKGTARPLQAGAGGIIP